MALTAAQRRRLPKSAFVIHSGPRSNWAYPIPTPSQAKAAGISERQRGRMLRAALSYSGRSDTRGSSGRVRGVVRKRNRGAVQSVKKGGSSGSRRSSSSGRRSSRRGHR